MNIWHCERGSWSEVDWDEEAPDEENEETFLKRMGYELLFGIGEHNSVLIINVYERAEAPKFYITLWNCAYGRSVTAGTLPDALDLLARYAPIITAAEISSAVYDITTLQGYGLLTDIAAGLKVNSHYVDEKIEQERTSRAETQRRLRQRRLERERAAGESGPLAL